MRWMRSGGRTASLVPSLSKFSLKTFTHLPSVYSVLWTWREAEGDEEAGKMAAEGERRAGALGDRERIYEYHGRAVGLLVVAVEPKVLRLAFAAMSAAELACCVASTPPPDRKFEKVHLRIQRLTKPITVQSIADEGKGSRG